MSAGRALSYNIHLRFSPASFAKIQAARNANIAWKKANLPEHFHNTSNPAPFPYLSIFDRLPLNLRDECKETLAKIAAQKKPFVIKTSPPRLLERHAIKEKEKRFDISFGLDAAPIESIRDQIYAAMRGAFEDKLSKQKWANIAKQGYNLSAYSAIPESFVRPMFPEFSKEFPDGAGDLVVDGLCLKEFVKGNASSYIQDAWVEQYALKG
jgi:hypothetical protein